MEINSKDFEKRFMKNLGSELENYEKKRILEEKD